MRTIKFNVKQQRIKNVDSISFVFGGTDNYLKLDFEFSMDWYGCVKGICFGEQEHLSMLLKDDSVVVPAEAFNDSTLVFYLVGKKHDYRIQTQKFSIRLGG